MLKQRLSYLSLGAERTLLCVGPTSKNCVDAICDLSYEVKEPIVLIASRRQIECEELGCGYVNAWSTEAFGAYVRERACPGQVLLARDHGGPWQGDTDREYGMSTEQAMAAAKRSFKADIESGFDMIHIDPSIDPRGPPSDAIVFERVLELYGYCTQLARSLNREVLFEVGTEEQNAEVSAPEQTQFLLEQLLMHCRANELPDPTFIVAQTGAKVMEMTNVGAANAEHTDQGDYLRRLSDLVATCDRHRIYLKAHNGDYLSRAALATYQQAGIHAINVAPELGVTETRTFIDLLRNNGLTYLSDRFIALALASQKWKKWMLPNTTADDTAKATIAGHYLFASRQFQEITTQAREMLAARGIDLDAKLRGAVRSCVEQYMTQLRYGGARAAAPR